MPRIEKIKLPDIGEGIAEGEIVRWLVREGDSVKQFQPLVEVLTDKANVEIPSPHSGKISRLLVKEGERVRVGTPIAEIEVEGSEAEPQAIQEAPRAEAAAAPQAVPAGEQARQPVRAPPSVRKLAQELGVDLSLVRGTGPGGVITREDVTRYYEERVKGGAQQAAAPPTPAPQKAEAVPALVERIPLRGIKRRMAERMVEAKSKIPHVYLAEEVDATELVRLRESLKQVAEGKGVKLTYLPLIVKAVVKALKEYPLLNSTLDDARGEIVVKKYYNIGVAIDTDQGLVVPNIKNADKKGLFEIAREIESLAARAREGKISLDDIRDGTFTITNVGAIGSSIGFPIINYPESAILGIHRILKRPGYFEDRLEPRHYMVVSLSFDHRFIEGAYAARFLVTLKKYLENPVLFLAPEGEFA